MAQLYDEHVDGRAIIEDYVRRITNVDLAQWRADAGRPAADANREQAECAGRLVLPEGQNATPGRQCR